MAETDRRAVSWQEAVSGGKPGETVYFPDGFVTFGTKFIRPQGRSGMAEKVITSEMAEAIDAKRDEVAAVAGGYSTMEWGDLLASSDPLDALTVQNFRVVASRVLTHLYV